MTSAFQTGFWSRARIFSMLAACAVLALFIGANAHLIVVAFTSKPDCVLQPQIEGAVTHRAAKPSC